MRKSLILLAVPALFFLGCKPASKTNNNNNNNNTTPSPKACFTINKSLIDSGETVTTSNCSTNATSYGWNFGLGLQSSSTANSPSWQYRDSSSLGIKPVRGTAYKIELTAFGPGVLKDVKDTFVSVGRRQIDSIKIVNIPVVPPYNYAPDGTTKIAIQMGPGSSTSKYSSPQKAPSGWPYTFDMSSNAIIIGSTNNQAWAGRIINISTTQSIYSFQKTTHPLFPGDPFIYFSRGVNVSPIKVTDNAGFEMDVYYSVVK